MKLEICANSYRSAIAAQEGGAYRVELCDNLIEGGTTPSFGQIALCKKNLHIKIYPIIRPRGGDFLYSNEEFEIMKEDIKLCKSLNCDGVVFGILKADGTIDEERNQELINLAKPMPCSMHRAIDMTPNLNQALETCIKVGFERILSSGGQQSALQGASILASLIKQADGRISIMPGAGINPNNLKEIKNITGAIEFHASAKSTVNSQMQYKNEKLSMGSSKDEYIFELTIAQTVKQLVQAINS